jgi:ribonucleoside-diphosphate reductase alpha chain
LGKAGGCDSAQLEAISRLASLALRSGVEIKDVIEQLRGITCCPAWDSGTLVRSGPDAVALALQRHITTEISQENVDAAQLKLFAATEKREPWDLSGNLPRSRCPDCSSALAYQEGCLLCTSCGWNKCG